MVPVRPKRLKQRRLAADLGLLAAARARVDAVRTLQRPVGWALALWGVVILLPFAWLFPGERLARPVCVGLVALGPVATLLVASSGQAQTLLVTALGALVPALVACPELLAPRVRGPVQGLAVAGLLVALIASALDAERQGAAVDGAPHTLRPPLDPALRMRALLRPDGGLLLPALGALWLAMAWFAPGPRTVQVAMVAATWMLVFAVPLGARRVAATTQPPAASWWVARAGGAVALIALWRWWA